MPVRMSSAHTAFENVPSAGAARPDARLALLDQAFCAGHRVAGQKEVMQVGWLYQHAIDLDAVERFHHNLAHGLLGRRIERSPLPFARYRWVADPRPLDIDIATCARPRAELGDWFDERAQLPIDPESGPAWRLSILPLTDGSTGITFVISHYVLDGIGSVIAIAEAIMGVQRDVGYPPPRSRTRLRAVLQDAGETVRAAPDVARAIVAAARNARRARHDIVRSRAPRPIAPSGGDWDDPVAVPGLWIHIDMAAWDARAKALGGTDGTLGAALTAKLAERMGRRNGDDGTVVMQLLMSDRTEGDTRAVAVAFPRVRIDPTGVTSDLQDARAAIKQALKAHQETPDEASQVAPLAPFTPKRTWKRVMDRAIEDPDHPVVFSNLGDVGDIVTCLDGTRCEYGYARGTSQHLTRRWLERTGGKLQLLYFRMPGLGKVSISLLAYQLGAENTKSALRELVVRTLAEFDLAGEID